MANSMENANIQINSESLPADVPVADRVNYENQLAQSMNASQITTIERPTEIPAAKVSTRIVIISRYLGGGCSIFCVFSHFVIAVVTITLSECDCHTTQAQQIPPVLGMGLCTTYECRLAEFKYLTIKYDTMDLITN